eukprot:gene14965-biopygen860
MQCQLPEPRPAPEDAEQSEDSLQSETEVEEERIDEENKGVSRMSMGCLWARVLRRGQGGKGTDCQGRRGE